MNKNNIIKMFSLAATGKGISGGDRIFIELARRWSNKLPVEICTTIEGKQMLDRQGLTGKKLKIDYSVAKQVPENFLIKYIYKIFLGIKLGLTLKLENPEDYYLYSSSEYWMDSFPAIILKLRYRKSKWIACWFQTAPNPLKGYSEIERKEKYRLSALGNWIIQFPIKLAIKKFAHKVLVNNEEERKVFPVLDKEGKTIVLIGAVRFDHIKKWKAKNRLLGANPKYAAVFQGRFHPQKGVVELIDIWKSVVEKIPDAKLAMIGDGPLMEEVKSEITNHKLRKNVTLFGYVFDGDKKYKIFSESKLVVHPAFFDSGGMASAEAMAFGIPAIGFNLKSYQSYYPKGMLRVKKGDIEGFSQAIIELIRNEDKRKLLGKEALEMIKENWTWEKRAEEILTKIIN